MSARYTRTAIALHWLMAVLLVGLLIFGTTMTGLKLSPLKLKLYSWHKWAGVTAFLLVLFRLTWRAGHRPPDLPESMPALLRRAADATHVLLYLLMIALPLSGWLMSSAKGFQTVYFGVLPIPDLLAKDKATGDLLRAVHEWLGDALIAVLALHAGAALKHHFIDRNDFLTRMLPGRRPENRP